MTIKQEIKIKCADGFDLAATIYRPQHSQAAIMIAPATGIKRRFYNSFATYLAANNYTVICFDNRGIGDSIAGDINRHNPSLINWGKLDMTAVLEYLKLNCPQQTYHLIGHSAGGQLVGLMDNALEIKSIFNFASSSGSLRNMQYPFKLSAGFFLNLFVPLSNLFFAQTNSQWLKMGEPLPKKVAQQWQKWCSAKGYVETDFDTKIKHHYYYQISCPSMWLHASDDKIANLANVKDMVRVYTQSSASITTLNKQDMPHQTLGHMGFFSSKNKQLWSHASQWLAKHS